MKRVIPILVGLLVVCAGMLSFGCKKKGSRLDRAFHHTADHAHAQVQDTKVWIAEALKKQELQYIHDNIYRFESQLNAFSDLLDEATRQRLDERIKELEIIAQAIDNSAGRKNQAGTEANVKQLIDALKRLETEYKQGAK